jgi:hypothetical protein
LTIVLKPGRKKSERVEKPQKAEFQSKHFLRIRRTSLNKRLISDVCLGVTAFHD